MTSVPPAPFRLMTCRTACPAAARHPGHHDRLLNVDIDVEELLALLELAVTWRELDYSEAAVLGPADWLCFAQNHAWNDPERAERVFSLAMDIVGRGAAVTPPESSGPASAGVVELVRG